jgi:glyoxylase-like metal-dependent hydrolase (beta-lactamase superfamily II)
VILKQLYLNCLSQASYLVGSDGEAAVIDPRRDVDEYVAEAEREGLQIRHVLETHFHADFVSGHRELAARTGARIYFGRRARPAYPVELLGDGDEIRVGGAVIRTLETPGHTPESVCFLVFERAGNVPRAVLTGDTLFVGEVGRPDLMGTDLSAETMAGMLHDSLRTKILPLPDDVIVYPGHGPGSACGRNIGPETSSTIGKERRLNYALNIQDRDAFIRAVTTNLPRPPRYFPHDARLNREGPELLENVLGSLQAVKAGDARRRFEEGEVLPLDVRSADRFGAAHVPGALNIGLQGRYAAWAGTLVDPATPVLLVTEPGQEGEAAVRLARVGYDNVVGYLEGGMESWTRDGLPVRRHPQIGVDELRRLMDSGGMQVLDVRGPGEWEEGHIAGARQRCLTEMAAGNLPELDPDRDVALICGSGYRSSAAASLLEQRGHRGVLRNVTGGMQAWRAAGLPVEGT